MLTDKVVWVTGASRGIGQAIALVCARAGAQTVLVAKSAANLEPVREMIQAEGLRAPLVMDYDITDGAAIGQAMSQVYKQTRRIDVVVNNAGVMLDGMLGMITDAQLQDTFDVNMVAAIHHMQYASRLMRRAGQGSIINIASIMGRFGNAGQVAYCASKAGLIGATLAAAKEMAPHGIRVNTVAPGMIETALLSSLSDQARQDTLSSIGMGRIGTPEDVAKVVLFFASDLSAYVTGQVLGVDGGMVV